MTTIPIARRVSVARRGSIVRAAPILVGCAAAMLHIGCAADDEGPHAVAREDHSQITRAPEPSPTASATEADVAAVRMARWRIWDRLARELPDGYLLSIELLDPPTGPAFAVVTLVQDHRAVQNVVGVPLSAATAAAMTASGDPASPEAVAIGEPPPKQPSEPGIVALGNALLTAAFHDNALARRRTDGSASTSGIAAGDPPPEQAPQPGFGVGEPPPKEDPHLPADRADHGHAVRRLGR